MPNNEPAAYSVVYCVMGPERGANLAGHASIVLVQTNDEKEKEVKQIIGYYPVPPQNFIESFIGFDMSGNHGVLKAERPFELDVAFPMYGKEFALTKALYEALFLKCKKILEDQAEAISEHSTVLKLKPSGGKTRHYSYEENALVIFELEKERSKTLNLPMRLKPFELLPPNLSNCKFQALDLLVDIISPGEIKSLEGNSRVIPRMSGKLDKMFFHAEGTLHPHFKKSKKGCFFTQAESKGEVVYSRELEEGSRFLLTTCPQDDKIINIIERLRKTEKLLEHPEIKHPKKEALLNQIKSHYQSLARYDAVSVKLFGKKQNSLQDAKNFLDTLYVAVIGEYEKSAIAESNNEDLPFLVLPNLTLDKKKAMCDIFGKTYVEFGAGKTYFASR